MGKSKKPKSEDDLILSKDLKAGIQYVYVGLDNKGQSLWRLASPPPSMSRVGPAEAGHRDMKRKGISVQNKITKPLPGRWRPGMPRRGGWALNGKQL